MSSEDPAGGIVPDQGLDQRLSARVDEAFSATTRVVLVAGGVTTEHWADSWHVLVQDGGRTVKLFASGTGGAAAQERKEALGRDLGAAHNEWMGFNADGQR